MNTKHFAAALAVMTITTTMTADARTVRHYRYQRVAVGWVADNNGRYVYDANGNGVNRYVARKPVHRRNRVRLASLGPTDIPATELVPAKPDRPSRGSGSVTIRSENGATARVGSAYAEKFQAYIDDLEKNHGAKIMFMGGIRRGRCSSGHMHPCGKALDVCQLSRGVVSPKCNLPDRDILGVIAAKHGLFEGGQWCNQDYGHAQAGVSAPACGTGTYASVRRKYVHRHRGRRT